MRVGFICDLQAHNFSDFASHDGFINSRLQVAMDCLDVVAENSDVVVINGDLYHDREKLSLDVIQHTHAKIRSIAAKKRVIISAGNHDQFLRNGLITSTSMFEDVKNVIVVSNDGELIEVTKTLTLAIMPFQTDLQRVRNFIGGVVGRANVLVLHQGVLGAMMSNGSLSKHGLSVEDLNCSAFEYVILGDYHRPQNVAPNAFYVGSPYQIDRGEKGQPKRVCILHEKNGHRSIEDVPTHAPEFIELTKEEWDNLPLEERNFHYYRVILPSGEKPPEVGPTDQAKFAWAAPVDADETNEDVTASGVHESINLWLSKSGKTHLKEKALKRLTEAAA